MSRQFVAAAILAAAPLLSSSAAFAHATLATTEVPANSYYKGVIGIGHGCSGSPTTLIRVTIPEGVIAAKPMPKPGWTVETEKGPYQQTYDFHGRKLTEGVKSITWKGGRLPDDFYDEFVFQARVTGFPAGSRVSFPVLQTCESGETDWAQIAAAGQNPHDLKAPAPGIRIVAAAAKPAPAQAAGADAAMVKAGSLVIAQPWTRATPAGAKVAGGYLTITNSGTAPDRLLGGTSDVSTSVQVHEMAVQDGVMRMRELDKGLEIPAGGSVALKPGGLHLMLMGLKRQLKAGETVNATLTFEKAGAVPVVLSVGGVGAGAAPGAAPAAGGGQGGHHHDH